MVVVQDQHDLLGLLDQLVDQHGQDRLERRLAALEQGVDPLTDAPAPITPEQRREAGVDAVPAVASRE